MQLFLFTLWGIELTTLDHNNFIGIIGHIFTGRSSIGFIDSVYFECLQLGIALHSLSSLNYSIFADIYLRYIQTW